MPPIRSRSWSGSFALLGTLASLTLAGGCGDDVHRDRYYGTDMGTTFDFQGAEVKVPTDAGVAAEADAVKDGTSDTMSDATTDATDATSDAADAAADTAPPAEVGPADSAEDVPSADDGAADSVDSSTD